MQESTGKFLNEKLYTEHVKQGGPELPQLHVGEIVEIKGVRFKVQEVRSRGRLYLKMCKTAEVTV
jgi:hypothetical protein